MLTVVVCANDSAAELAGLLAALVPAAVDGLVREVIVVGTGSAEVQAVCEDAGAGRAVGLSEAAAQARYDTVLVLPAEMRLKPDWQGTVAAHLARRGGAAVLTGAREGWLRTPAAGVLSSRAAVGKVRDLLQLRRAARGPRL